LLARSIAQVEAPHQLTCNIIAPGLLAGTSAADIARIAPPLGRPARRAELNAAVRYLLSDAAAQVSGTILPLSGAWRLR
jgi:NAD(P)-dependent dehydrogenase (short-subunit alcohol dehydrogenase family)